MGPYVEDLSTFVANSYSDIEVRVNPANNNDKITDVMSISIAMD